eukprot:m51a1_g2341 putative fe(2+) transport protein 2 (214) ;mRNA; f:553409-554207
MGFVLGVCLIAACGLAGVYAPLRYSSVAGRSSLVLARSFGAGVVLGTAMIHVLPYANDAVSAAMQSVDYPVSAAAALLAALCTLAVEQSASLAADAPDDGDDCDDGVAPAAAGDKHQRGAGRAVVAVRVMELGVALHSVVVGAAFGATPAASARWRALLAALCAHQLFEGVALGAAMADARLARADRLWGVALRTGRTLWRAGRRWRWACWRA